MKNQLLNRSNRGFTLLETLIVLLMIGILSTIIAPGWLGLLERQRLNTAQDQVYRAMREAQSNARRTKVSWQASFRVKDGLVQWAVHSADSLPNPGQWQNLDSAVQIDVPHTTLPAKSADKTCSDPCRVQFNDKGNVVLNPSRRERLYLSRLTLNSRHGGGTKRCVFVSTILGAMRTTQDNACKVPSS